MHKRAFAIVALILAVAAAYGNSLWGDFTFDDDGYILRNPFVTGKASGQEEFNYRIGEDNQLRLRKLSILSYRLNYIIHGFKFLPGWHLFNILVHLGCVLMLYFLFLNLEKAGKVPRGMAVLSSLVFAVWPVGSEAVNYLSARQTTLMAFFTITSVYFALRVIHAETGTARSAYSLAALAAWGGALISKEVGVIFPPLLILVAVLAFSKDTRWFLRWHRNAVLLSLGGLVMLVVVGSVVVYTVKPDVFRQVKKKYTIIDDDVAFYRLTPGENFKAYELTRLREFPRMISLMLGPLPGRLSIDHHTPWIAEVDWRVIVGALLLLVLLGGIVIGLLRAPPVGFGLAFFLIPLLPYWFIPSMIIVEYKLHLPLAGAAACFGFAIAHLYSKLPGRRGLLIIPPVALLVVWGALMSAIRNTDWRDPVVLWEKAEALAPEKARPPLFVGVHLYGKAQKEKSAPVKRYLYEYSAESFRRAARKYTSNPLHPGSHYTLAYSNLAMASYRLGKFKEACRALDRGAGWRPENDSLIRGVVAMNDGRLTDAEKEFKIALKVKPDHIEVLYNYTLLLLNQSRLKEAASIASSAVRYFPTDPKLRLLLAQVRTREGDMNQAVYLVKSVIKSYPGFAEAHFSMSALLMMEKKHEQAVEHLKKARKSGLNNWQVECKLGEAYLAMEMWENAAAELEKAASNVPKNGSIFLGLAKSYYRLGREEEARTSAIRASELGVKLPAELKHLLAGETVPSPK